MKPPLDQWLAEPSLRVVHRRESRAAAPELWEAARTVKLSDTRLLGRLVRWRIPGTSRHIAYYELFSSAPFTVIHEDDWSLVSGLVGRIWTLKRDYPRLAGAEEFRDWSEPGTARVLFANWVEAGERGGAALASEARVTPTDREGRLGLRAVRPLVAASNGLIAREGIAAAVRLAEDRRSR